MRPKTLKSFENNFRKLTKIFLIVFLNLLEYRSKMLSPISFTLQVWKRRCNSLSFKWGTIGMTSLDEPRPNFRGQMGLDAITGRMQPQYPRWKTNAKVSNTIISFALYYCYFFSDVLCFDTHRLFVHVGRFFRHVNFVLVRGLFQAKGSNLDPASTQHFLHWFGLRHEHVLPEVGDVSD